MLVKNVIVVIVNRRESWLMWCLVFVFLLFLLVLVEECFFLVLVGVGRMCSF